jgi:hypothetical protein
MPQTRNKKPTKGGLGELDSKAAALREEPVAPAPLSAEGISFALPQALGGMRGLTLPMTSVSLPGLSGSSLPHSVVTLLGGEMPSLSSLGQPLTVPGLSAPLAEVKEESEPAESDELPRVPGERSTEDESIYQKLTEQDPGYVPPKQRLGQDMDTWMKRYKRTKERNRVMWTDDENQALNKGVSKYGTAWAKILQDPDLADVFKTAPRTSVDLKDRWRNWSLKLRQANNPLGWIGYRGEPIPLSVRSRAVELGITFDSEGYFISPDSASDARRSRAQPAKRGRDAAASKAASSPKRVPKDIAVKVTPGDGVAAKTKDPVTVVTTGMTELGELVSAAARALEVEVGSINGTFALAYPALQKVFTTASNSPLADVLVPDEDGQIPLIAICATNVLDAAQRTWS